MTGCICHKPGWCDRHQCQKADRMFELCQTRKDYWDAWENGRGPGQNKAVPKTISPTESDQGSNVIANAWCVIHARLGLAVGKPWDKEREMKWYNRAWLPSIPVAGCACREHWDNAIKSMPIDWSSAETAFHDLWRLHNHVSRNNSGKPTMTLEQAQVMYIPDYAPKKKRCVVCFATGRGWGQVAQFSRISLSRYAIRCGADYYELRDTTNNRWDMEKFRTKWFADKYEQTLLVDADVWIKESCPDVFDMIPAGHVGMHDDYSHMIKHDQLHSDRKLVGESQSIDMGSIDSALNTGFVLCDKSTSSIWEPPKQPLPPDVRDSARLWVDYQARRFPIFSLPTDMNTQPWMGDFFDRKQSCHVLHFASSKQKLMDMHFASKNFPVHDPRQLPVISNP